MFYPSSKMMECAVDNHFRNDASGRLVFVPSTRKGKCYFVDSKSDEGKIRAYVKMFRSSVQFVSFLSYPSMFLPGLFLDHYADIHPRDLRMGIAFGIPLFFLLILSAVVWFLWHSYKGGMPALTASLTEVAPEVKAQLRPLDQSRRPSVLVVAASAFLMVLGLCAFIILLDRFHR
jgi:hypothetical protein